MFGILFTIRLYHINRLLSIYLYQVTRIPFQANILQYYLNKKSCLWSLNREPGEISFALDNSSPFVCTIPCTSPLKQYVTMSWIKHCILFIKYWNTFSQALFPCPSPNTLRSAYKLASAFRRWYSALVGYLGDQINNNAVVIEWQGHWVT